jgi:hypothetical protein
MKCKTRIELDRFKRAVDSALLELTPSRDRVALILTQAQLMHVIESHKEVCPTCAPEGEDAK